MNHCRHALDPATCWDCAYPIRSRRPEPPEPSADTPLSYPDTDTGPNHRAVREARDRVRAARPAHRTRCSCSPCELVTVVDDQAKQERNRDPATGRPKQDPQPMYAGKDPQSGKELRVRTVNWDPGRDPRGFDTVRDNTLRPPANPDPEDPPTVAGVVKAGDRRWQVIQRDPEYRAYQRMQQPALERAAKTSKTAALVLAVRQADGDALAMERWYRSTTELNGADDLTHGERFFDDPHGIGDYRGPYRQARTEPARIWRFTIDDEAPIGGNFRRYYFGPDRSDDEFRGWQRIRSVVPRLAPRQEVAVVAFWDHGGNATDAAAALGITEQGFRQNLRAARAKLAGTP